MQLFLVELNLNLCKVLEQGLFGGILVSLLCVQHDLSFVSFFLHALEIAKLLLKG